MLGVSISVNMRTELEMYAKLIDPICIDLAESWAKSEVPVDNSELC